MARRSKEAMRAKQKEKNVKDVFIIYQTVGYVRLSGEDIRHTNNINTLKDQKLLVTDYIEKADDLLLCNVFSDNGVSGMSFNRPGFEAMIQAIKEGKYNCVVVKDLSRFGRNHIEAAYYLYKFFPEHNVRFISINDGYDSNLRDEAFDDIILPIKNLINENYAREVSRKVGISKKLNREKGLFIHNFTPYGYKRSEVEKGKLVVDETVVPIVKRIFDLYVNKNMRIVDISKLLNDEQVLSPSRYKYDSGFAKCKKWENAVWSYNIVRSILKNRVYIGDLVLGKCRTEMYKNESTRYLPEDEWTIIPKSHEPIISRALFEQANEKLDNAPKPDMKKKYDVNYMFNNLYCGCCGAKLAKKYELNKCGNVSSIFYYCISDQKGKRSNCSFKRIYQNRLLQIVFCALKNYINSVNEICENYLFSEETIIEEIEKDIKKFTLSLESVKCMQTKTFDEWVSGSISDKEYKFILESYNAKIENYKNNLMTAKSKKKECIRQREKRQKWAEKLLAYESTDCLTKEMINEFVDKIIFYDQMTLEICFKFADVFDSVDAKEILGGVVIG